MNKFFYIFSLFASVTVFGQDLQQIPSTLRSEVPCARNATLKSDTGPLIQAHRGGRFEYDDNAAGGFVRALKRGLRGFETDVRFTKDHQLVIMHDSRVDRTTDGTGTVESMTLDELKKSRLQSCSEPVPSAAEVFATLERRGDVFIEIEMKAYPGGFYTPEVLAEYCRSLSALAKEKLAPGTYAFTCFNKKTLETMRAADPTAPLGLIVGKLSDQDLQAARQLTCCSIAPTMDTEKAMIDKAHAAGLTVCLWMVQDAGGYAKAKAKGADRVTSDYPHLLDCAVRGKFKKLVAIDLDATFCQHHSPIPADNLTALKALDKKYKCLMVGAGNAPQIYQQMSNHPIDKAVTNYDATLDWAKTHGYTLDDIVFIGDDFSNGGGDSHVRIRDIDRIVIKDYKNFWLAARVLTEVMASPDLQ